VPLKKLYTLVQKWTSLVLTLQFSCKYCFFFLFAYFSISLYKGFYRGYQNYGNYPVVCHFTERVQWWNSTKQAQEDWTRLGGNSRQPARITEGFWCHTLVITSLHETNITADIFFYLIVLLNILCFRNRCLHML